jgi:hypothetical protein
MTIAGVAALIIVAAVWVSKRRTVAIDSGDSESEPARLTA